MAGDQKGEFTKDEKLLLKAMHAQLQQKMKPSFDRFRQEFRQQLQQATGHSLESRSSERRQRREHESRKNIRNNFADQKIKIPPFYGDDDPASYVEWEEKMELIFSSQNYSERKKVQLATAEFYGYASSWWNKLRKSRRLDGKEPVSTWLKLSSLMRREYVPRQYYKEVLQKQKRTRKEETQGNFKTAISNYCANITSSLEKDQVATEVPKELEEERGNITYEQKEVSECSPRLKDHKETNLLRNYECSHHSFHSGLLENTQSSDELTCLEPVQPSSLVSLTQVAEEDSSKEEPESMTQGEQQKNLKSEAAHESLSYDLQEHSEKGTGEKRGYNYQSIKDESLAKLEMQQEKFESCLAARFDIGAVRGSYLNNQKELISKLDCHGNLTHQGLASNWNHVQRFSDERVMGSTSRLILCVLCLNFSEFKTSQSYLWQPGEHPKVIDHVFKNSFVDYTDMMHLFLSKEPCADYKEAWKQSRRKNKHEEDKRFKPPDLDQERYPDVLAFILIKEAPPDEAYKPEPSRNKFGIRLLLFDKLLCANLFCFIASGVRRANWISVSSISESNSNNAYLRGLQGKADLRSNLFEEGGDDMIMESTKDWKHEPDPKELVAEDATLKNAWKQEEGLGRSVINQDTLITIHVTLPSS